MPTRPAFVGLALASLLCASYLAASCASPQEDRVGARPTGANPSATAKPKPSSEPPLPANCTATTPGSDGRWLTPSDGCYQPVVWPDAGCHVEVALAPQLAAPPLEWIDCGANFKGTQFDGGNYPGCTMTKQTWSYKDPTLFQQSSILRTGAGYRVGFGAFTESAEFAAIYDEAGKAIAAWRLKNTDGAISYCKLWHPLLTGSGVWLGAMSTQTSPFQARYLRAPWDALVTANKPSSYQGLQQYWTAGGSLMASWLLDGATVKIVDGDTNQYSVLLPGDHTVPQIVGEHALALVYTEYDHGEVAVWSRKSGKVTTVVETIWPDRVKHVSSDGKTLAWIVQPDNDVPGWLWTSPFGETKGAITPQKRRPTPPIRGQYASAGGGYYAVWSIRYNSENGPGDGRIHVYRLSDAREWSFDVLPHAFVYAILYIDEKYLFYQSAWGLARVDLAQLGPGTPAP